MSEKILPWHCGYEGKLEVVDQVWLECTCPQCQRTVKAFTPAGLIEQWNKPKEPHND